MTLSETGASPASSSAPFRVLIAGGGVAALEAALALRELAGGRVTTAMLAPNPEFVYRPMTVQEPFSYRVAESYPIAEIAREIDVELRTDSLQSVDAGGRIVHTESGDKLAYDALLLAPGARAEPRYESAVTIDDKRLDERFHGLIRDVEEGYVQSLAFVVPARVGWPLPVYELALMTASRAYDMNIKLTLTIATPEDAPLTIFGEAVSTAVSELLHDRGINVITSAYCEVPDSFHVEIRPGDRQLEVNRVVALPELWGPAIAGLPEAEYGFIPIDTHCQVPGTDRVFAAGDATDFAVKHGGLAAQQADTAAEAIAALAGAPITPRPFHPVLHGILLGGDKPLYLSTDITGGHGSSSQLSDTPTWSPPSKIAAKYLAPYLAARDLLGHGATALR